VLTIGFNVIYLTSEIGFEGCQILLCVNLKSGNDNWGLMWYRRVVGVEGDGFRYRRRRRRRRWGFGGESLNLMELGRQIYHPKPLSPCTPYAVPFFLLFFFTSFS